MRSGRRGTLRVRFWGTRGSIATPGPMTTRFGGNTSCVEILSGSGERLILDCGTGGRPLAQELMARQKEPLHIRLLIGHTHWDHIQGFPFFAPAFDPENTVDIFAPAGGRRSLREVLAGQMEFTYFPVQLGEMGAKLVYNDLTEGEYRIGSARVVTQYLHHPAVTLGYRIEMDGVSVAYLSDHEPFSPTLWRSDLDPGTLEAILHEGDRLHARLMTRADLVIHDAQYTPAEYAYKRNWGHSPYVYPVELALLAGARRLALTHHEPSHDDDRIEEIEADARELVARSGRSLDVFCAREGSDVVLRPRADFQPLPPSPHPPNRAASKRARILVVDDDETFRLLLRRALEPEQYRVLEATNGRQALRHVREQGPDLVVLDHALPEMDGLQILDELRRCPETAHLPVLMLTGVSDEKSIRASFAAGVTDYLIKPVKVPQLTSRVRALLVRAAFERRRPRRKR